MHDEIKINLIIREEVEETDDEELKLAENEEIPAEEKNDEEFDDGDINKPWPNDSIKFKSRKELDALRCSLLTRSDTVGLYKYKKGALSSSSATVEQLLKLQLVIPVEKKVEEIKADDDFAKKEYTLEEKEKINELLNNYTFSFYEEKPGSAQDSYPYIDEELMVVCDGLGGAGNTIHDINPNKIDSYEKLSKIVLPEDNKYELKDFFKKEFKEILDNPKISRKSAYWASRILIVNYVYAFKNITHDPNKLRDFCYNALVRFVKKFDLEAPSSQRLLPSTLVSIYIKEELEDKVNVEVLWSGDSRAYILTKDGYKPISKDHEDSSGSMDNLFLANRKTYVEKKEYTFDKPCSLLVVSDGTFDDRDNYRIEKILLDSIMNANNVDEIRENMREFYIQPPKYGKTDDTTVAFRMFGYNDVAELKESLKDRYSYINSLYDIYSKNSEFIDAEGGLEGLKEDYENLKSNYLEKYTYGVFAEDILNNKANIYIPANFYEKIKGLINEENNKYIDIYSKRIKEAVDKIFKKLEFNNDTPVINAVVDIRNSELQKLFNKHKYNINDLMKSLSNYREYVRLDEQYHREMEDYKKEIIKINDLISDLVKIAKKFGLNPEYKKSTSASAKTKDIVLSMEERNLLNSVGKSNIVKEFDELINSRKDLKNFTRVPKEDFLNKNKKIYENSLTIFKKIITESSDNYAIFYNALLSEYKDSSIELGKVSVDDVYGMIIDNLDDQVISDIIDLAYDNFSDEVKIRLNINASFLRSSKLLKKVLDNPIMIDDREKFLNLKQEYEDDYIKYIK